MVQDNKVKSNEGSKFKDLVAKSLNQNLTKVGDNIFQYAQKSTIKIDSTNQSKQFQTYKKQVLTNKTSSCIIPSYNQLKPYSKEMLFSQTINNYNKETPKSRWRKIPSFIDSDDQLENASKSTYKVLQSSQNKKTKFNVSLNVHSSKHTNSKESYVAHNIHESYGSYSSPSIPYNHNYKYDVYYRSKQLSNSYHETLLEPIPCTKYHINYAVINDGHVVNAQLDHETNFPQYKWKETRQLFYDYEKKKSKKFGVEKEQIISTTPFQKWIPLDKNTTSKNESHKIIHMTSIVSQCDKMNTIDFCFNEKEEKRADTSLNIDYGNCNFKNTGVDIVINEGEFDFSNKDLNKEYLIVASVQHLPTLKPMHHVYSSIIKNDLRQNKRIMEIKSNLLIGNNISSIQNSISTNGALQYNSQNGSSHNTHWNSDDPVHSIEEISNIFEQCKAMASLQEEKPSVNHDCQSSSETTDAALQHLVDVIAKSVHYSVEAREASQSFATCTGAPLAEIERFLFAVAPKVDQISSLPIPNNRIQSNKFCNYKSNLGSFEKMEVCSCQLDVPLSSIWKWYEKPSNYGLEVQALDFLNAESKTCTYLAYFLPFLSGIQIYGYKKWSSCMEAGCVDWNILNQHIDALKKANHNNATTYATSAQLLFEFFDSDPPSQRQPLFQKIYDLLQGKRSYSCQSSGNASYLEGTLLKDLHPASWFAIAWYPIYRISVGPLKSVLLTYHSFHHIAHSNTLQCLLGQNTNCFTGNLTFPVIGLESYNTQRENWSTVDALLELKNVGEKYNNEQLINHAEVLIKRIESLQKLVYNLLKSKSVDSLQNSPV